MHKLLSPTPTHTSCLGSLRVMTVINDGHGEPKVHCCGNVISRMRFIK